MSEWVKMADKTPPEQKLVLCCGSKGGMFLGYSWTAYVYEGVMHMRVPNARGGRSAVYWMPLPEAPSGIV